MTASNPHVPPKQSNFLAPLIAVILLICTIAGAVKLVVSGPKAEPASASSVEGESPVASEQSKEALAVPAASAAPTARNVPLAPPPSNACVDRWCGKSLGYASIIVDVGRRETTLPHRAWVIAVATAMQESTLANQANKVEKVKESVLYPYDKVGDDHDSLGLFQQRPSWGSVAELMDPRKAALKFYQALARVMKEKGWTNWENPQNYPLTRIAQAIQVSQFPNAYARHEPSAAKIVDLVLRYPFKDDNPNDQHDITKTTASNGSFLMVQCTNPMAASCRAVPFRLSQPVDDNRKAFAKHFPKVMQGNIGNADHQNDDKPQDHTPITVSKYCNKGVCHMAGWVYAMDIHGGEGFDLRRFGRWIFDRQRGSNPYEELKYLILTLPGDNKGDGRAYYGMAHIDNGWAIEPREKEDHPTHIHLSFRPGFERSASRIIEDYVKTL